VRPLIDALAPGPAPWADRVAEAKATAGPGLDRIVVALTEDALEPSILTSEEPKNVVPGEATLTISATTLPATTAEELEAELREALGHGNYDLELVPPKGGSVSPLGTPLHRAVEDFLAARDPEARLVPSLGYGFSDCHVIREAYGSVAYGFIPFRHTDPLDNLQTKHGAGERVLVDDLEFQTDAAIFIARAVTGSGRPSEAPPLTARTSPALRG
jgi:acetylornithine deacetylase/succinyl-diaminopimelate desuccinylase-like protein